MNLNLEDLESVLKKDMVSSYYLRVKHTEKNSSYQYKGTMGLQKSFRMVITKKRYLKTRKCILLLQKNIRQFLARRRIQRLLIERGEQNNIQVFNYFAIVLQKK